jgi:hypothetical protein
VRSASPAVRSAATRSAIQQASATIVSVGPTAPPDAAAVGLRHPVVHLQPALAQLVALPGLAPELPTPAFRLLTRGLGR